MFYCKEEKLMALKWIANKSVHVISSIVNSDMSSVKRCMKYQKEKLRIGFPDLIKMNNKNMGGMDIRYGTVTWEVGRKTIISL